MLTLRAMAAFALALVLCLPRAGAQEKGKQPAAPAPAGLGGWEDAKPEPAEAPATPLDLKTVLPLYPRLAASRPPLVHVLQAIEQELPESLKREQYFQMLHRYQEALRQRVREQSDPQALLEQLSFVVFDVFRLQHAADPPAKPEDLFLSSLVQSRKGGTLSLTLLYLVVGRSLGLALHPAQAGKEVVVRLVGPQGALSVAANRRGEVVPEAYQLKRFSMEEKSLPVLSQAQLLAHLFHERGRLFSKRGQKTEAIRDLERAVLLVPDHKAALTELAALFYETKQADKAREIAARLIQAGGATPDLHWRRAEVFAQEGQLDAALADLDAYVKLRPEDARPWYLRGSILERKNDLVGALAAYQRMMELGNPEDRALAQTRIRAIRGPVLLERFQKAPGFSEKVGALRELAELGDPKSAPPLIEALGEENLRLRWQIALTLREILKLGEEEYLKLGIDKAAWSAWWTAHKGKYP